MRWLLVLLLWSAPALAQRSAAALVTVGDDAYAHGFFEDAIGAYRDAYHLSNSASLWLKIGTCQEKLGRWSEAAESYRRFLREDSSLAAGERADLSAKADTLEARARPAPSPAPVPLPPPVVAAPPLGPHVVGLRRAVVASAIATVVFAAAAGSVTIGAAERYSRLEGDCRSASAGCSEGARDRVRALDHAADSLWALTAAGAIGTLTLHLVLRHQKNLRAAVAPAAGGAQAVLGGEF
jgi:tetratricopeptide (TPR) repeat protein